MLLELLLAAAVLASIALLSAKGVSQTQATSGADPTHPWATRAQPVLTALIDDLAAVDAATTTRGATTQSAIASANRSLIYDDTSAHALGTPGNNLAGRWNTVLGQIDKVRTALTAAPNELGEQQLAGLSSQAETAAASLAAFVSLTERQPS